MSQYGFAAAPGLHGSSMQDDTAQNWREDFRRGRLKVVSADFNEQEAVYLKAYKAAIAEGAADKYHIGVLLFSLYCRHGKSSEASALLDELNGCEVPDDQRMDFLLASRLVEDLNLSDLALDQVKRGLARLTEGEAVQLVVERLRLRGLHLFLAQQADEWDEPAFQALCWDLSIVPIYDPFLVRAIINRYTSRTLPGMARTVLQNAWKQLVGFERFEGLKAGDARSELEALI
jgi:hypothetical protein